MDFKQDDIGSQDLPKLFFETNICSEVETISNNEIQLSFSENKCQNLSPNETSYGLVSILNDLSEQDRICRSLNIGSDCDESEELINSFSNFQPRSFSNEFFLSIEEISENVSQNVCRNSQTLKSSSVDSLDSFITVDVLDDDSVSNSHFSDDLNEFSNLVSNFGGESCLFDDKDERKSHVNSINVEHSTSAMRVDDTKTALDQKFNMAVFHDMAIYPYGVQSRVKNSIISSKSVEESSCSLSQNLNLSNNFSPQKSIKKTKICRCNIKELNYKDYYVSKPKVSNNDICSEEVSTKFSCNCESTEQSTCDSLKNYYETFQFSLSNFSASIMNNGVWNEFPSKVIHDSRSLMSVQSIIDNKELNVGNLSSIVENVSHGKTYEKKNSDKNSSNSQNVINFLDEASAHEESCNLLKHFPDRTECTTINCISSVNKLEDENDLPKNSSEMISLSFKAMNCLTENPPKEIKVTDFLCSSPLSEYKFSESKKFIASKTDDIKPAFKPFLNFENLNTVQNLGLNCEIGGENIVRNFEKISSFPQISESCFKNASKETSLSSKENRPLDDIVSNVKSISDSFKNTFNCKIIHDDFKPVMEIHNTSNFSNNVAFYPESLPLAGKILRKRALLDLDNSCKKMKLTPQTRSLASDIGSNNCSGEVLKEYCCDTLVNNFETLKKIKNTPVHDIEFGRENRKKESLTSSPFDGKCKTSVDVKEKVLKDGPPKTGPSDLSSSIICDSSTNSSKRESSFNNYSDSGIKFQNFSVSNDFHQKINFSKISNSPSPRKTLSPHDSGPALHKSYESLESDSFPFKSRKICKPKNFLSLSIIPFDGVDAKFKPEGSLNGISKSPNQTLSSNSDDSSNNDLYVNLVRNRFSSPKPSELEFNECGSVLSLTTSDIAIDEEDRLLNMDFSHPLSSFEIDQFKFSDDSFNYKYVPGNFTKTEEQLLDMEEVSDCDHELLSFSSKLTQDQFAAEDLTKRCSVDVSKRSEASSPFEPLYWNEQPSSKILTRPNQHNETSSIIPPKESKFQLNFKTYELKIPSKFDTCDLQFGIKSNSTTMKKMSLQSSCVRKKKNISDSLESCENPNQEGNFEFPKSCVNAPENSADLPDLRSVLNNIRGKHEQTSSSHISAAPECTSKADNLNTNFEDYHHFPELSTVRDSSAKQDFLQNPSSSCSYSNNFEPIGSDSLSCDSYSQLNNFSSSLSSSSSSCFKSLQRTIINDKLIKDFDQYNDANGTQPEYSSEFANENCRDGFAQSCLQIMKNSAFSSKEIAVPSSKFNFSGDSEFFPRNTKEAFVIDSKSSYSNEIQNDFNLSASSFPGKSGVFCTSKNDTPSAETYVSSEKVGNKCTLTSPNTSTILLEKKVDSLVSGGTKEVANCSGTSSIIVSPNSVPPESELSSLVNILPLPSVTLDNDVQENNMESETFDNPIDNTAVKEVVSQVRKLEDLHATLMTKTNASYIPDSSEPARKSTAVSSSHKRRSMNNDFEEAEKLDHLNPDWEFWKKLKNDKERYKSVRKLWKSLNIPDPKKNLTVRSWQKLHGNAPPIAQLQEDLNQKFEKRIIPCIKIFMDQVEETNERLRELDENIYQEMEYELSQKIKAQERELNNCWNANPGFIQNLQLQHAVFLQKIYSLYRNKFVDVLNEYECKVGTLRKIGEEVDSFHRFYEDLDSDNPDSSVLLTEEEFNEIKEINEMLRSYETFYA